MKQIFLHDSIENINLVVLLASDLKSFSALQLENGKSAPVWKNDTLFYQQHTYNLKGKALTPDIENLNTLSSYQEYWHSWRFFHPKTPVDSK